MYTTALPVAPTTLAPRSPRLGSSGFQSSFHNSSSMPVAPSTPPKVVRISSTPYSHFGFGLGTSVTMKRSLSDDVMVPSPTFFGSVRSQKKAGRRAALFATLLVLTYLLYNTTNAPRVSIAEAKFSPKVEAWAAALPTEGTEGYKYPISRSVHMSNTKPSAMSDQSSRKRVYGNSASFTSNSRSYPLTVQQELAALVSFISTTDGATLPENANPDSQLHAEWLLEFDITSLKTEARSNRLLAFEKETWSSNPVVIFTKDSSIWSKEVQNIMDNYKFSPPPLVVSVEKRADEAVMTGALTRLTAQTTLPSILVGGVPLGGYEELKDLHDEGRLKPLFEAAGVKFLISKPKKKLKQKQIIPRE